MNNLSNKLIQNNLKSSYQKYMYCRLSEIPFYFVYINDSILVNTFLFSIKPHLNTIADQC